MQQVRKILEPEHRPSPALRVNAPAISEPQPPPLPLVPSKPSTLSTRVVIDAAPAPSDVVPEASAPSNNDGISPWQILGWTAGAAGLVGLILWGVQSKENLKTTADILHLVKKVVDPAETHLYKSFNPSKG